MSSECSLWALSMVIRHMHKYILGIKGAEKYTYIPEKSKVFI